jgi:hypothetical protein
MMRRPNKPVKYFSHPKNLYTDYFFKYREQPIATLILTKKKLLILFKNLKLNIQRVFGTLSSFLNLKPGLPNIKFVGSVFSFALYEMLHPERYKISKSTVSVKNIFGKYNILKILNSINFIFHSK